MASFTYISDYELERATPYSAGFDLKCVRVTTSAKRPGVFNLHLGVKVCFATEEDMKAHAFMLLARSSCYEKYGIRMVNGVGLIDADYQGELIMKVTADTPTMDVVERTLGQKVAQIVPIKSGHVMMFPEKVEKFNIKTERGEGGFGSTDK